MRLSPSSMHRALLCAYWLRDDVPVKYSPSGPAAIIGTQLGARVERALTGRHADVEACAEADELFDVWEAHYGQPTGWRAEVAFAWNPLTDSIRLLGDGVPREKRGLKPGEMGMALDAFDPATSTVYDWKTGRQEGVAPAKTNPQLALYASCIARAFGLDRVRVVLSHITDHGVHETEHTYDAWDLDVTIPAMVRGVLERVRGAEPVPGSQCKWCPALAAGCPGPRQVADEALVEIKPNALAIRDGAHAGEMMAKLEIIQNLAAAVEDAIKAYVDEHGAITLPDGRRYGTVETTQESIDAQAALPILREAGVGACIELKVSKEAIKREIKAAAAKGQAAAAERALLAQLRDAGALKAKTVVRHQFLKGQ